MTQPTTGSIEQYSNNSFLDTCRRGINQQWRMNNPGEAGEAGIEQ